MSSVQTVRDGPYEESLLRAALAALRRRTVVFLVVAVGLPACALGYSLSAEKQYTAVSKLLFRDPGFDQKLFGGPVLAPSVDPAREAATNVGLASLDTVAKRAADVIDSPGVTAATIRSKVSVAAVGQSNVVAVSATDRSPSFAARLANTIAAQYIVFRRDADRAKIDQAVKLVAHQLGALTQRQRAASEGRSLSQQVERLRVLAALQTGNAELVQPAGPPGAPSSPKVVRDTFLALILGMMTGVGLAVAFDRLDRRLRDREDAEALLGRPALGQIPESTSLADGQSDALLLGGQEAEAFRTLRANLRYYDVDRDLRSLLITSSAPGDGKSTVARYLAATAAAAGIQVILVEADLRRPTLSALYSTLHHGGLSEVLSDQASLADTIQRLPLVSPGGPMAKSLDVLAAGSLPPNPTDLLESERMRSVLEELGERYDLVVIDSSPITIVPDSIPILSQVSGVLIVVRESKSLSASVKMLRDQFAHLGIMPLGLVMNGTPPVTLSDHYGYYSYAPAKTNGSGPTSGAPKQPRRKATGTSKHPASPRT